MSKFFKNLKSTKIKLSLISTLLSLFFLAFLSQKLFYFRWIGYESIPKTANILDEKNYVAAGYSFLKTGVPTAWSNLNAYTLPKEKNEQVIGFNNISLTVNNQEPNLKNKKQFDYPIFYVTNTDVGKGEESILLVQPFLDHSPLAGIFYSLWTKNEPTHFADFAIADFRKGALFLGIFSGLLIFLTAFLLTRKWLIAFFSFFIWSLAPTYVLASRYALIENLIIPLSLLTLIFLIIFQQYQKKTIWLLLAGLFTGLAISTKESGLFILLMSIIILVKEELSWKKWLSYLSPSLIIGSSFYIYAWWLAPNLWTNLFFNQIGRGFFGSLSFLYSARQINFEGFPLDGFWLWGLILTAIYFFQKEKGIFSWLLIGFFSYLLVFLIFGGSNYPWYWLPFIPFVVLISGHELYNLLIKPNVVSLLLFFLLPFSTVMFWGRDVLKENNHIGFYRLSLIIFLVAFLFFKLKNVPWQKYNSKFHLIKLKPLIRILQFKKGLIFKVAWAFFFIFILFITFRLSGRGIQYIIANWNHLPEPFFFK
jgi:hypothetical protein